MSHQPHHYANDPTGEHQATRAAHRAIPYLDKQIAAWAGDDPGLRDLKMLQGELVARHGLPPST
jgi:hypothetical protein